MSVVRWLFPVVLFACLGGFLVGYLAPSMIGSGGMCWGMVRCGVANGAKFEPKPVKAALAQPSRPALLSRIEGVKRGDTMQIVLQTWPGAVCAIRFQDAANNMIFLPAQFADRDGRCQSSLPVPANAAVGEANLLICASACLDDEARPYFLIQ